MKKLHINNPILLILTLSFFIFFSCQEYAIDSQPEGPLNIQIDAFDSYTVTATSPSNVVFNISSNTPWKITSDQQWCKPNPSMSASSSLVSEVVVSFESNSGNESRTARLTIEGEGINETRVITIEQVSKENLVVIPYDEMVPSEGGVISFNIFSNKPWEIIPSTQFLENIDKTSGPGNESGEKVTISITIPENSGSRRSGTLTLKTAFEEYTFTVQQDGVVIEQAEPTESGTIDFAWWETEKIVKVRSNTAWNVKVPNEYVDWIEAEALSDSEIKITLQPNNRLFTRQGEIKLSTVKLIPGFEAVSFGITQKRQYWFQGNQVTIDEETGNVKVMFVPDNNIVSNYALKKGKITFEFDEMHLTGNSRLVFNMWSNIGNTNFHFWLRSDAPCQVTCGGSGFAWQQMKFSLTEQEVNAIKKIDFFVEDDPENVGKLRIRLMINDVEKVVLKNKSNPYVLDPNNNSGQTMYLQIGASTPGDYYVIKSITHEPYE
ncbi:MAG: BACON domain-containing carbohydrate-binding protein [Dysgonamonadaceae bacterium]|nr:BACON domain-containing carbohydrate-binding protein [Dysgonamonadaceae bacterium]MDD3900916.1 BACON domain-containing carbohydrate-binding protein [Dysgonamonadaceae bacterium]